MVLFVFQRDTSPTTGVPANGLLGSNTRDPVVKEEVKAIDLEGPTQSKRPRIPELPLHGAMPAIYQVRRQKRFAERGSLNIMVFSFFQTWAQAAANLSSGSGGSLHPATVAAAWSKHLSQAQAAKVRP